MLVLRVRNVGEFCEADYFEEKKYHACRTRLFDRKEIQQWITHIHVTHETDDFRELLQMTWLLTFILKKIKELPLDYGAFLK